MRRLWVGLAIGLLTGLLVVGCSRFETQEYRVAPYPAPTRVDGVTVNWMVPQAPFRVLAYLDVRNPAPLITSDKAWIAHLKRETAKRGGHAAIVLDEGVELSGFSTLHTPQLSTTLPRYTGARRVAIIVFGR